MVSLTARGVTVAEWPHAASFHPGVTRPAGVSSKRVARRVRPRHDAPEET
jgi:hypothetical protein